MDNKKMSAPKACALLAGMMRKANAEQIDALNMGINQIMHHYRCRMKNYARRAETEVK